MKIPHYDEEVRIQELNLHSPEIKKPFRAKVTWTWWGPEIENLDGDSVPNIDSLFYNVERVVLYGERKSLEKPKSILLNPRTIKTQRTTLEEFPDEIYPPSTGGWYEKNLQAEAEVRSLVQRECNSNTYWLTQIDEDNRIVFQHPLRDYEVFAACYEPRHEEEYKSIPYKHKIRVKYRKIITEMVQAPPPKWEQLYRLTKDYDIEGIQLKEDMLQTVMQLVPTNWPQFARFNYALGLIAILNPDIMKIDPIELSHHFSAYTYTWAVVDFYITEALSGTTEFDIVRIINQPRYDNNIAHRREDLHPWRHPATELFRRVYNPSMMPILMRYAQNLTESQVISKTLPVTDKEAKGSAEKWRDRHYLMHYMGVDCRFNPERLGLKSLIYLGGAYRWPFKNTSWQATLSQRERTLQIQEMLLPPTVAEKVNRALPRTLTTEWYSRRVNNSIFDPETREWTYRGQGLAEGLETRMSKQKLNRTFPLGSKGDVWTPDSTEAKVIDTLSNDFYLQRVEGPFLYEHLKMNADEFVNHTNRLTTEGKVTLFFILALRLFTTRCIFLEGDIGRIRSLAFALLGSTPTCSVYLFKNSAFLIVSMHQDKMYRFVDALTEKCIENDLQMEVWSVRSFGSYRWPLLQRMLREDGTWDDDISGLLCQGFKGT